MRKVTLVAAAALLLAGVACSSKKDTGSTPQPTTSGGPQVVMATDALKFGPAIASIKVGETIEWQNNGTLPHTVTFTDGPKFEEQLPAKGKVTRTFSAAGTFNYKCTIHPPGMIGQVVVA